MTLENELEVLANRVRVMLSEVAALKTRSDSAADDEAMTSMTYAAMLIGRSGECGREILRLQEIDCIITLMLQTKYTTNEGVAQ